MPGLSERTRRVLARPGTPTIRSVSTAKDCQEHVVDHLALTDNDLAELIHQSGPLFCQPLNGGNVYLFSCFGHIRLVVKTPSAPSLGEHASRSFVARLSGLDRDLPQMFYLSLPAPVRGATTVAPTLSNSTSLTQVRANLVASKKGHGPGQRQGGSRHASARALVGNNFHLRRGVLELCMPTVARFNW